MIIGIDLGTTNSLVAFPDAAGPRIIGGIVPSVVGMTLEGELVVGRGAADLLLSHPRRVIYSVKRLMGKGAADVKEDLRLFPFAVAEGSESVLRIRLGERVLTPPEVSAQILRRLKLDAEAHF
ncbi:MAG TPA: Hsp70 family protein, partial [Candidatus Acidoferrales bacterium]|nr:Hsp70 family protein [Candidatus Acidoferrales bacterium]